MPQSPRNSAPTQEHAARRESALTPVCARGGNVARNHATMLCVPMTTVEQQEIDLRRKVFKTNEKKTSCNVPPQEPRREPGALNPTCVLFQKTPRSATCPDAGSRTVRRNSQECLHQRPRSHQALRRRTRNFSHCLFRNAVPAKDHTRVRRIL